ncbi:DUF6286 domain-containing protein [Streptomyces antarcticus]|uniref:DUF6286 domain-containing protein n=1 Tax=Streptomyces antarcticus TaxID=2996458 RepID=UPI00227166DB|nr:MULTISPECIES: DUF6286 domain-containing protein [unclassified Streptomyces]MCY0941945.1 DUF6286 domain-containing protein [Streptomyces sp. H34-AA3]MCZ4082783.1 DUF6286 domain-containing protein [Streptomyces sp. H34-S5]
MTAPPPPAGTAPSARLRSARRVPAALAAVAVMGAAGVLLYDLIAVRAHRPGMSWRRYLAHQLERQTPADPGVILGGGVLAAVGLLLLVLALAPGLRSILPMGTPDPDRATGVRAALGRKDAAQVLRDRAMEVPGVRSARVKVGRSRIRVRATSHFRELEDVRADLDAVLAVGVGELGLAHPPRTRVRVGR